MNKDFASFIVTLDANSTVCPQLFSLLQMLLALSITDNKEAEENATATNNSSNFGTLTLMTGTNNYPSNQNQQRSPGFEWFMKWNFLAKLNYIISTNNWQGYLLNNLLLRITTTLKVNIFNQFDCFD